MRISLAQDFRNQSGSFARCGDPISLCIAMARALVLSLVLALASAESLKDCIESKCRGCGGEQCQLCREDVNTVSACVSSCMDSLCRGCGGEQCQLCREDASHIETCCSEQGLESVTSQIDTCKARAAWRPPARVAAASSARCATKMFRGSPAAVTSTTTPLIRRRCAKTPRRKLSTTALIASAAAVVVSSASCAAKTLRASAALDPCGLLPANLPRPFFHKRRNPMKMPKCTGLWLLVPLGSLQDLASMRRTILSSS